MLESLEERLTPSGGNSTVTQTAGGYTALTGLIKSDTAANTNYVIEITNSFTFNSGGQVNISKLGAGSTLTLEGQSGTNFTLTGNGNRLFEIGPGQNVSFVDLTLTGGALTNSVGSAQGGAIEDLGGNVTLSKMTVANNSVTGNTAEGGGIYVSGGGNLTIENGSAIQANSASGGSFAAGGGVFVFGASTIAISDSTLSNNRATGGQGSDGTSPGAGGSDGANAYGGGMDVNGSGWTVTLTGDTLSGNTLTAGNGGQGAAGQDGVGTNSAGGTGGNGGMGGFATGGGAYFFVSNSGSGQLTILNDPNAPTTNPSTFLDNSVQSGAGGSGGSGGASTGTAKNANGGNGGIANAATGGALFLSSATGASLTATISNTTFSGNKVSGGQGGAGGAAGTGGSGSAGSAGTSQSDGDANGGGIALENGVVATLNNSTIANNTAADNSSAYSVAQGGGIFDYGGSLTLKKAVVQSNTAGGIAAAGGGIYESKSGSLSIEGGSAIQSNRAAGSSTAYGGGVFFDGNSAFALRDSIVSNNRAQGVAGADGTGPGSDGGDGGNVTGGGLYVSGDRVTATLIGATLAGNSAVGGNGGNGAAGGNATGTNASGGNGGKGGGGGGANGGAAYFAGFSGSSLTILDDLTAPDAYPSIMIDNTAQGGAGGNGGAGGASTGTANNSNGGDGGFASGGSGGAISLLGSMAVQIGNTTFYGNKALGSDAGLPGVAGTGGSGTAGQGGANPNSALCNGGGLDLEGGNIAFVNNTVAKNTVTAGFTNGGAGTQGGAIGGGIEIENFQSAVFDNNTITQNTISGGIQAAGSGVYVPSTDLALFNNLIQGNQSVGSAANDLETASYTLANASNNFITSVNANAVSSKTNIIGNSQTQLGNVVGVDSSGKPTGGPIYYPLLPGTVSVGAGTTSVLSTIAGVEGTTPANTVDEIGNPRSDNGSIDLGAVQVVTPPVITGNPSSRTVTAGQTATFTASASGSPTPTVQWRVSTNGGKTFTTIGGATSSTLTLNNVSVSMSGYEYQAVFTNSAGTIATSAATLTVNPVPPPPPPSPPAPPPAPPALNVPPLLALVNHVLGAVETVNGNGTETITDIFFGIHLFVSTFDSSGNLVTVTLFGFNVTFLFA